MTLHRFTLLDRLSRSVDELGNVESLSGTEIISHSLLLVGSLTVLLPVAVLVAQIPLLIAFPLIALGYTLYCYRRRDLTPGLVSAFFILAIFGANIPIFDGAVKANLSIFMADFLAIGLLASMAYHKKFYVQRLATSRLAVAATSGLVLFVFWSFVSAAVGNGPSQSAAVVFALQQTRYLLFFLTALAVVSRSNFRIALYPLTFSIIGNLTYSIAEGIAGHTFGLTYLGDSGGRSFGQIILGPFMTPTGLYAGGFVGSSRELLSIVLLILPLIVFWTVYRSKRVTALGLLALLGTGFFVKFCQTDAGWAAGILSLLVTSVVFLTIWSYPARDQALYGLSASLFAVFSLVLFSIDRFSSLYTGSNDTNHSADTNGTQPSSPDPTSGGGNLQNQTVHLFSYVPFVNVNTLGIRLQQYAAAIDIALVHPFVGIGGYNFVLVSATYGIPKQMGIHNTLFSHLAATGIIGLLGYLISICAVLLLVVIRSIRGSGRERAFWGCAFAGLLGFHAFSFWVVIYGWQMANNGFWVFSGILVGAVLVNSE